MAKPVKSANVSTNNILLKVTVPKRTGLKRRRGADGPYYEGVEESGSEEPAEPMLKNAHHLWRSMYDNSKSYQVEAVGTIDQTHRFRGMLIPLLSLVTFALTQIGMPDFVTSTENMPLIQKFQDHILPFKCEVLHLHREHTLTARR